MADTWSKGVIVDWWFTGRLKLADGEVVEITSRDVTNNSERPNLGTTVYRRLRDGAITTVNPDDVSGFEKRSLR